MKGLLQLDYWRQKREKCGSNLLINHTNTSIARPKKKWFVGKRDVVREWQVVTKL